MLLTLAAALVAIAVLVRRLGGGGAGRSPSPGWPSLCPVLPVRVPLPVDERAGSAVVGARRRPDLRRDGRLHRGRRLLRSPRRAKRAWLLFGVVMGMAAAHQGVRIRLGRRPRTRLAALPGTQPAAGAWPWVAVGIALADVRAARLVAGGPRLADRRVRAQRAALQDHPSCRPGPSSLEQVTLLGPLGAIVAVAGLVGLATRLGQGRAYAMAFVFALTVFLVQRSKPYYTMPAYPVLLAAGGIVLERWAPWRHWWGRLRSDARAALRRPARPCHAAGAAARPRAGLPGAPRYHRRSGERHRKGALPQHFADMFGWDTLADDVARVVANACRRPSGRRHASTRRTTGRPVRSNTTARHAVCRR